MTAADRPRLLITGGCGRIGLLLARHLTEQTAPPHLTLLDRRPPPADLGLPYIQADIADYEAIRGHFAGQETVVHLAAESRHTAAWGSLLPDNIIGTYHVLQAAHEAGCRRVILASSIHAVSGYDSEVVVRGDVPPRPVSLYGASKAWAESVGSFFAHQGLSVLCVRIGWLQEPVRLAPGDAHLDWVITPRDLLHLLTCCIAAPAELRYGVFLGLSANRERQFDISTDQSLLGYRPQDDVLALARGNYRLRLRRWAGRTRRSLFTLLGR